MITYPKIDTLWNRDPATFAVKPGEFRRPEFSLINKWMITEKVDGTNIRVGLTADGQVEFGGRTDNAQMPPHLLAYLTATFPTDLVVSAFEPGVEAVLFGEGYGEKIQKGGGLYRRGVSFRLFDVWVNGWWLNADAVADVASKLNIATVPVLGHLNFSELPTTADELRNVIDYSIVAHREGGAGCEAEGIVARTDPLIFGRGSVPVPLKWKLKARDFK